MRDWTRRVSLANHYPLSRQPFSEISMTLAVRGLTATATPRFRIEVADELPCLAPVRE